MRYGKCGALHFGGSNLRKGASYASDHCRTLIGSSSRRIERYHYHMRVPTATGSARNGVRNPSNSAVSIAFDGSHVALSQYLLSFSSHF